MSAEFNAEICAVHLGMLLRRTEELMNDLMVRANQCDLTRDRLPAHLAAQTRADGERAKAMIRAWCEVRETAPVDAEKNFYHQDSKTPRGEVEWGQVA